MVGPKRIKWSPVREDGSVILDPIVSPTPCPICKANSPCIDYNSVDNGVGMQIFECRLHGVFTFGREGDPCWMNGEPEPEKLTVEKLAELDAAIGWDPKVNPG